MGESWVHLITILLNNHGKKKLIKLGVTYLTTILLSTGNSGHSYGHKLKTTRIPFPLGLASVLQGRL